MDRLGAFGTFRIDLGPRSVAHRKTANPVLLMIVAVILVLAAVLTANAIGIAMPVVDEFGVANLAGTL